MDRLNELEVAALLEVASQYPDSEESLSSLFCSCMVTKRENTGAGFFVSLEADHQKFVPIGMRSPMGDAWISIDGMRIGICCIVFLTNGYPSLLEGFSVAGENTSEIDFATVQFTVRATPQP